jgi:F0F1-type ATP synthase assembly protein I
VVYSSPLEPSDRERSRVPQSYMRYSHLGLQFAATIALLTGGGFWLDRRWGTTPLCILIGLFLGFGAGFYHLYRAVYTMKPPQPPQT